MKTTINITLNALLRKGLLACLSIFIFSSSFAQDGNTLSVIANQKGAPAVMKYTELKNILRGEKQRWPDGTKIVIALMKTGTPVGQNSAKRIYNMTGDELNRFWLALVFQGKVSAPTFFNSAGELENFIAQTPGAIGIVSRASGTSTKIITVDGKKEF